MTDPDRRRGVRSVERALDILSAFSAAHPRLQLAELAEAVGLPRPSAHRIAASLIDRGFLRQDPDGAYLLGIRLLELGSQVAQSSPIIHLTEEPANELVRLTGETVLVAEVDWTDLSVVIIGKRAGDHPPPAISPVGRRMSLASGGLAKAILLALPPDELTAVLPRLRLAARTALTVVDPKRLRSAVEACRLTGYAVQSGEFLPGTAAAAAPVFVDGRVAGALAVVGASARFPRRRLDETGQLILRVLSRTQPV